MTTPMQRGGPLAITPGCEEWSCDGGDVGVLVLHGWTGNPSSMRPLAEHLAAEGFAIEMPRLPGHGTPDWRDLKGVTWEDGARATVAAFRRLRDRTQHMVIAGLSAGAVMALWAAGHRPDVDGLVLINPSYDYTAENPQFRVLPLLSWLPVSAPGIGNDIAKPGADEHPAARYPLRTLADVLPLQRAMRRRLPAVVAPTLVFTSRQDHVNPPSASAKILDRISSTDTEQVWLERSYHVATLDYDAPVIHERSVAFIRRVTGR
jgi:carboxylesterase